MSSRYIVITVVSIVGLVILLLSFVIPVKTQWAWMDYVTRAIKVQDDWDIFGKTSPVIRPSPLAEWIVRREGGITYDWHSLDTTGKTVWDRTTHSTKHGINRFIGDWFTFNNTLQENFIKSSTDEEVQRFIDTMRHGTGDEQTDALEAAIEKGRKTPRGK